MNDEPPFTAITNVSPARVENATPSAYRLAIDPWGKLHLQGRHDWSQGTERGHEWKTIPTVTLGSEG